MIRDGNHNHEASEDLAAHPTLRKLTISNNDRKYIQTLATAGAKPMAQLAAIRQQNPSSLISHRDIYNTNQATRLLKLARRLPIQALLDTLIKRNYKYQVVNKDKHVTHLFFAHP